MEQRQGKVTVLSAGKAQVKVTVIESKGKELVSKTVEIEAFAQKAMKEIKLEKTNDALSTKDVTDLKVKAQVLEQSGKKFQAPVTEKVLDKDGKELKEQKFEANNMIKDLVLNEAGQ